MALVPYIMPGFDLAKKAAEVWEENPDCEGLLLINHGHFAWGPDAKSSYDRLVAHTNEVEAWLVDRRPAPLKPVAALPAAGVADLLPVLRGVIASHLACQGPRCRYSTCAAGMMRWPSWTAPIWPTLPPAAWPHPTM